MTVSKHIRGDVVLAYCEHCDVGCSMCRKTHDQDGKPLRVYKVAGEGRRVCYQCGRKGYDYDALRDEFVGPE
jgi:hypothetical protein